MPSLTLDLLGSLKVVHDDRPPYAFKYNKARALLAYLAMEDRPDFTRAEACALLWPELGESAARRNLSQVLSSIRVLAAESGTPDWLLVDADTLTLNPVLAWHVDVRRFLGLLDESERHAHHSWNTCAHCARRLEAALALYRGDFLGSFSVPDSAPFEEWVVLWRERLRQRLASLLERLCQRAEWRTDFRGAAEYADTLVALDDLREASHRERIRLLALDGQWAAAEAQYEQLRRTLARELDVAPADETTRLVEGVRARAGRELAHFEPPALRCPSPPDALIGRGPDLERICERLRAGDTRILTLTGAPGLGKTRLALEAARALRFDFEDGVVFVDLAPLADPAEVPGAVCVACGLVETGGRSPDSLARARLKTRHLLLVLDNVEHVLGAAAWVGELLAECPGLHVLATSRAPLRIRGEHQWEPAPLTSEEAVRLFIRRAAAIAPGFTPTGVDAEAIAAICARVDALPLAIELVAVHLRSLTPAVLLQQLTARLPALETGSRDAPERHRTLRAAIDWSYTRLDESGQRLFARLGALVGGGTVEAANALFGAPLTLMALGALVDASLVRTADIGGEIRLSLLETVREFALERLGEGGDLADVRERHADYFLSLAERAQQASPELAHGDWLDRLSRDHDNLRAALDWRSGRAPVDLARFTCALRWFWEIRGHLSEGRHWLTLAFERLPETETAWRARVLETAAVLAARQGDYAAARTQFTTALELFEILADEQSVARVWRGLGNVALAQSDYTGARAAFDRALADAQRFGDLRAAGAALNALGLVEADLGRYEAARDLHRQAVASAQAADEPAHIGYSLLNLSLACSQLSAGDEGHRLLQESLTAFRRIDHKSGIALALYNLGNTHEQAGDLAAAETEFRESLALHRELGDEATASYPLFGLGKIALSRGDMPGARRLFLESLRLRHATGELRVIARTLNGVAELDRRLGYPRGAARLFGAAEALRETLGTPVPHTYAATYAREVEALRAVLGESTLAAEWAAGRALNLDQAVALASADGP